MRGRVLQQLMDGTGRSATAPSSFLSFLLRQTQVWENDVAGTQICITTTQNAPETQGLRFDGFCDVFESSGCVLKLLNI